MLWYDAFGPLHYWKKSFYNINEECRMKSDKKGVEAKRANSPLKLKQLSVAFLLLLVGYLIALFQFTREMMKAYLERNMKVITL